MEHVKSEVKMNMAVVSENLPPVSEVPRASSLPRARLRRNPKSGIRNLGLKGFFLFLRAVLRAFLGLKGFKSSALEPQRARGFQKTCPRLVQWRSSGEGVGVSPNHL